MSNASSEKSSLIHGILIALFITGLSYAALVFLSLLLWQNIAVNITLIGASTVYCIILFTGYCHHRSVLLGSLMALLLLFGMCSLALGPLVAVGLCLTSIWLMRCLATQQHLVGCILDAILCLMSSVVAFAAGTLSNSVIMSIWVFFLMQSLFIFIPKRCAQEHIHAHQQEKTAGARFPVAYRAAQDALERLMI
jgi:hypothetical protein